MQGQTVMNWIHVATGLGVLAGLLLVFAELQQAKQLAAAELISVGFSEGLSTQRSVMGEEFAGIYARACLHPAELTEADVVALDFYFQSQLISLYRLAYLDEIGGVGAAPDEVITENLRPIVATEIGRQWIRLRPMPGNWVPLLKELTQEPANCGAYYEYLGKSRDA
jgi:hypothetical protein